MAISSRFQPRNLAQQRFNPFYGEMPEIPWGPGIQRRTSRTQNGTPMFVSNETIQGPDTFHDAWVPPDIPIDFTPDDSYLPWWMLDGPGSSAF